MSSKPQWNDLSYEQPMLDLRTSVQYKGKAYKVDINDDSCREALIYNIGDWMGELVADFSEEEEEDYNPTPWKKKKAVSKPPAPKDKILLNVESLRQAEGTRLIMSPYDDDGYVHMCQRECCRGNLVHAVNSLVSLPALLLNPDRYTGDWWEQTENQMMTKTRYYDEPEFQYWGADNSILQHPALVSIMFGLFRQAVVLHKAGMVHDLEKVVSPAAVRTALFNSNEKAALKLVQKLKPWLYQERVNTYLPISGPGKWELFLNLHKAIYKHGFTAVFGEIENAWELASRGIKTLSGSHSYFRDKKKAANVNKLAKKAA